MGAGDLDPLVDPGEVVEGKEINESGKVKNILTPSCNHFSWLTPSFRYSLLRGRKKIWKILQNEIV